MQHLQDHRHLRMAKTDWNERQSTCLHPVHGVSAGRTSVPAAMCPLGSLARSSPARVPRLPPAAGLCVAGLASVPPGAGLLGGAAVEAGD